MQKEIAQFYDEFAHSYRSLIRSESRTRLPAIVGALLEEHQLLDPQFTVLDLGCGPGNLRDYTPYQRYVGVDIAPQMREEALKSGYERVELADYGEVLQKAPDQAFDGVFAVSSLYFTSPKRLPGLLEEIDRVAKRFWLVTLDGIPKTIQEDYRSIGIETYDVRQVPLPSGARRLSYPVGWRGSENGEAVPVEVVISR